MHLLRAALEPVRERRNGQNVLLSADDHHHDANDHDDVLPDRPLQSRRPALSAAEMRRGRVHGAFRGMQLPGGVHGLALRGTAVHDRRIHFLRTVPDDDHHHGRADNHDHDYHGHAAAWRRWRTVIRLHWGER